MLPKPRNITLHGLACILGALSCLAMAPYNIWPVLFLTFSALYILLHITPSIPRAALLGFCFGLGYFGFGLYWIGNALLVEGNPYRWAWPLAVIGLPLMLSPFTALACGMIKKFARLETLHGYLLFCLFLGASEWLRGHLFTGFPWNLYGYTWVGFLPVAQIAALYDVYLLTLLTLFWASLGGYLYIAKTSPSYKIITAICVMATLAGGCLWGTHRLQNAATTSPDYNLVLVQPNIPQDEKWDSEKVVRNFMTMVQSSANTNPAPTTKPTYIIWPETAISSGLLSVAWARTAIIDMLATYSGPVYLISGAQRYEREQDHYFNSILVFNKSGEIIHTYNKFHLVPFGEYMPLSSIFDIAPIVGFKGFEKGTGPTRLEMPEGQAFSPLICYEIIFPNNVIDPSQPKPDFIVNVTNDAWYGISAGPYQHLVQTQFRAIETGLPVIRVANTGFTAIIDPNGRLSYQSTLFKATTHRQ